MTRYLATANEMKFMARHVPGQDAPRQGRATLCRWLAMPVVALGIVGAGIAGAGLPGGLTPISSAMADDIAAQQEVRLQQMQQQMADLQGQIEQLQLKVNDLNDKLDRAQKDNEFRLNALEQAGQNGGQGGATGGNGTSGSANPALGSGGTAPSAATNGSGNGGSNNAGSNNTGANPPSASGQPNVLGTLTSEQAANLPQAPAGAAEAAAAAAGGKSTTANTNLGNNIVLPGETPREQYEYAIGLLQKGQYPEAEVALKSFVKDHPSDPLAGNAQYWLGETYYARKDFKSAAVAFAEGYQKYPNSSKAADNLLKLGMSLGQNGQKDNACVALKQLDKKYPDATEAIKDRSARAKQRFGCS